MSLLQRLFGSLFSSLTTASRDASNHAVALTGHVGASGSTTSGSNHGLQTTPITRSPTFSISNYPHADRFYGMGLLIASSIGLRARLGFLNRPATLQTSNTLGTPATSASSPFPVTPDIHQSLDCVAGKPRFAGEKAPKLIWKVPGHHQTGSQPAVAHDSAKSQTRNAEQRLEHWLAGVRRQAWPLDDVSTLRLDSASHASLPQPRCYADAAVQTDGASTATAAPSPVPTELNTPAGNVRNPPAHVSPAPYVPTVPNTPVVGHSNTVPTDVERKEHSASVLLSGVSDILNPFINPSVVHTDETKAHADQDTTVIPLSAIPHDLYNEDPERYPDTVAHNGVEYQIVGMLGEGSYGRVFQVFTSEGKNAALKVVHKRKCYRYYGQHEALLAERNCMAVAAEKKLPFWANLVAAWEDEHNVYMEMDLCTGSLRDLIRRANRDDLPMNEHEVRLLCAEMLLSVYDLERNQVVHGDIKPDNFLVTPSGRVVLADFGLASIRTENRWDTSSFADWETEPRGTAGYTAPMALRQDGCCTHKTDIFSLGIVFLELMAGLDKPVWDTTVPPACYPGGAKSWHKLTPEGQLCWLMDNVEFDARLLTADGWDLCNQMLMPNPPTVQQLSAHPYFAGMDFGLMYNGMVPHEYQPEYGRVCTSSAKCDLAFTAWNRGEEGSAEYDTKPVYGKVVNSRGSVVHSRWLLDNDAVKDQMKARLPNFEWPIPPRTRIPPPPATAPPMLCRKIETRRESPLPAPPGCPRTPGHRQGPPRSLAGPAEPTPLYPPGLPHPPNQ